HRPGCARGGTGAGLTEISGIPAYNPCLNSPHIFATVNQIKIIYLLGLAFAGFLMLNKRKT
ncbi:hypothetical protein LU676_31900, partial [Pseudomonas alloputida]|uniref:hypothetical protein n=1 Tax=Pseudomonas alloputida TaxID=1940621 RepID=UPI001E5C3E94